MADEKMVSERDAVKREREAYLMGYCRRAGRVGEDEIARITQDAKGAYPLPKVNRLRVDSLESALREAQKDVERIDADALVRAILDCTPTLVNDDWYERYGPLTGELVAAANMEIAIRLKWKQDLRKVIEDVARADTGERT